MLELLSMRLLQSPIETENAFGGGETTSVHLASQLETGLTRPQQLLANDEYKGVFMLRQPTLSL